MSGEARTIRFFFFLCARHKKVDNELSGVVKRCGVEGCSPPLTTFFFKFVVGSTFVPSLAMFVLYWGDFIILLSPACLMCTANQ